MMRDNEETIKKNILRRCIGCFKTFPREEMIKITRDSKTGKIFINPNSKIFGRSVYLCYNDSCINNSLKKNRLMKFLKTGFNEEFKQKLLTFQKEKS